MRYHLGVDLGTTYTAAALARDGRVETVTLGTRSVPIPSVVHLAGDHLLVGEPAARRAITDPERVAREFKRRVGDPTPVLLGGTPIAAELLMARTLEWVVCEVAATEGGPPAALAVTHPANWHDYKLDLVRQATRHVGLEVDRFIPEPVAAATMYASQRPLEPGTVVAVYDLGGGTFDAAVVRADAGGFEIVGRPEGIERLGGIDFDHAVFRHVLDALDLDPERLDAHRPGLAAALVQLRQACVEAKEALSAETDVSIPVMLPERHTEVRLTREELEEKIRPALRETVVALRRAIEGSGVAAEDVSAVLLVGGSSRIPLVGQLVGAELRRPIAADARPKDAIPTGAALALVAATPPAPTPTPAPVAVAVEPEPAPPAAPAPVGHAAPPAVPLDGGPPPAAKPVPSPRTRSAASRRPLLAGGVLVLVAGVIAAALALGGGDDGESNEGATTATASGETSERTDGTTTGSGSALLPDPLPGDDWNADARAAFVTHCQGSLSQELASPEEDCGCIYDETSQTVAFADFNRVLTQYVEDDPTLAALQSAFDTCTTG